MFTPLSIEAFFDRTGLSPQRLAIGTDGTATVVSFRDLIEVTNVQLLDGSQILALLDRVGLAGDPNVHPYRGCSVKFVRTDPNTVKLGQTFIEEGKLLAILRDFSPKLAQFTLKGYAKVTAFIAHGFAKDPATGLLRPAIALYLPPIIESFEEGTALLDGVHRLSLARGVGTSVETIKVYRPKVPFPCGLNRWDAVKMVGQKPPKDERFFDLKPELFRDLKFLGIDG